MTGWGSVTSANSRTAPSSAEPRVTVLAEVITNCPTRRPSTHVPFVLPASTNRHVRSGVASILAWIRDTFGLSKTISQAGSRPMSNLRPASHA